MKIFVNGEEYNFNDKATIQEILEKLAVLGKVMAVAVNSQIVRKDSWEIYTASENDKLELLQFTGGG